MGQKLLSNYNSKSYNLLPMLTETLNYDLPPELIAQQPAEKRSSSRLLVFDRKTQVISDKRFEDITQYLKPGDCLVLNDTKVLPARFFAKRQTGAKLEGLFIEQRPEGLWQVMLKNSRKLKLNERFHLIGKDKKPFCDATAVEKNDSGQWLINVLSDIATEEVLGKIGFPPLPPYIKRDDDGEKANEDLGRYQTVYAKNDGAVAAPTAGMHFTDELIAKLKQMGIKFAYVTLHVGAGTFKPVTAVNLDDHDMHSERYSLDDENAAIINECIDNGSRIIAVGTTSVRTLETIAKNRKVQAESGSTRLFIKPGFKFNVVDTMITNFHLPKSTLIALVGAFAGMDEIMGIYKHAIENKYRFYSYGDSMIIL